MNWPLTPGLLAAWIILPALVIIAVCRRTLFGDPVEDITDYGADWPRVDPAFHEGVNSDG
jgi:hypothetical protein